MSDSFTLGGGPYDFFVRSSFSAAWSSIDSASSFFSLRFSSSSDRRLALPCRRTWPSSCTAWPPRCRACAPGRPSLPWGRTLNRHGEKTQWQVTSTLVFVMNCSTARSSTRCVKPRSSSRAGGGTTTLSDLTPRSALGRQHQRSSSRYSPRGRLRWRQCQR